MVRGRHCAPQISVTADDTNLFISGKTLPDLYRTMNSEMIKIVEWLNVNKLSLNLKKTHYMVYRSCKRIVDSDLNITINRFNLVRVESTKFLGTVIDSKLCWQNHRNFIREKFLGE